MKALNDMGHSPTAIAKGMGKSHHTVIRYLQAGINDPEIDTMVELIKQSELNELHTIGFKARKILSNYLDAVLAGEKEPNPISVTAILDRTFTQRRLIEGLSTENYSVANTLSKIEGRIKELKSNIKAEDDDET